MPEPLKEENKIRNAYTKESLKDQLLAHFERRFKDELKRARDNGTFVNLWPDIDEGAHGKLTATVTLSCSVNGKLQESRALYEYRPSSMSAQRAGWYCYHDWRD